MKPLAPDFDIVVRAKDPMKEYMYSPAIIVLPSGRYVVSYDIGDDDGMVCVSDDKGKTWKTTAERKFWHASIFADGDILYLLAVSNKFDNNLVVLRSDDSGDSWTEEIPITENELYHHCATDVWYKDGYVYVPFEKRVIHEGEVVKSGWKPNVCAPVVLRGKLGTDLTKRENWLFSEVARFRDVIKESEIEGFGIPFFPSIEDKKDGEEGTASPVKYRDEYDFENDKPASKFFFHATGWLETNIVQITDPKHYWYDPTGKTFHLFMRANTHTTGYCCLMKAVERVRDGKEVIDVECQLSPSGKRMIFLPMPGGQNKFFVKYDEKTKLYWLVSVQATDSMTRVEHLGRDRYNIPNDERNRLALHFSKNMVDWIFVGLVDKTDFQDQARHYASMEIDGDDLLVVSRTGDEDAKDAHDTNIISLHRIKNFRDLVY